MDCHIPPEKTHAIAAHSLAAHSLAVSGQDLPDRFEFTNLKHSGHVSRVCRLDQAYSGRCTLLVHLCRLSPVSYNMHPQAALDPQLKTVCLVRLIPKAVSVCLSLRQ